MSTKFSIRKASDKELQATECLRGIVPELRRWTPDIQIRRALFLFFFIGTFASIASRADEVELNGQSVFALHSNLNKLTPKPRLVSEAIAVLCTSSPSPALLLDEKARSGPHMNALVNVYVSKEAIRFMTQSIRRFAEGTVVLKEKLNADGAVVAVGGMIKRSVGFDREHNDWEYFYAEKDQALSKGRLANCIQCHAKAKDADYVYMKNTPTP